MSQSAAENTYIVAGSKSWNRALFESDLAPLPGRWLFIGSAAELTRELLEQTQPRYLFFVHWSWKVPDFIVDDYQCVCFHMTDVPYGRGGSPLQNLILRGHTDTKLSALRMTHEMDAGPLYLQRPLSLGGSAEEIYRRAMELSIEMIKRIVAENPAPTAQVGTPVLFKRRTPQESELPLLDSLEQLYDFIRMLDAEGYPKAFVEAGGFRFEFDRASLNADHVTAGVKITKIDRNGGPE